MAVAVGRAREEKALVLASGGGSEKLRNARLRKKKKFRQDVMYPSCKAGRGKPSSALGASAVVPAEHRRCNAARRGRGSNGMAREASKRRLAASGVARCWAPCMMYQALARVSPQLSACRWRRDPAADCRVCRHSCLAVPVLVYVSRLFGWTYRGVYE